MSYQRLINSRIRKLYHGINFALLHTIFFVIKKSQILYILISITNKMYVRHTLYLSFSEYLLPWLLEKLVLFVVDIKKIVRKLFYM